MRLFVLLFLFVTACQHTDPAPSSGTAQDPPVDADEKETESFKGQQRVPAEYEPARGVIISEELLSNYKKRQLILDLLQSPIETLWVVVPNEKVRLDSLKKAAGPNFKKIQYIVADMKEQWARGWAPLGAKTDDGQLRLIDFHYPINEKQTRLPAEFTAALNAKRISLPLFSDGGNFIVNAQGHCMMADVATDDRKLPDQAIRSHEDIVKSLQDYAGCKKVSIFPGLAMEASKHIDLWAKFLKDDLILVAQLRDEVVEGYSGSEKDKAKEFQTYLNERTKELEAMGFTTLRVPLPPIDFEEALYPSYLSALIVQDEIFVPTFGARRNPYPQYDHEVRAVLERQGFKVHTYNFDNVKDLYGAIHCATMFVPR